MRARTAISTLDAANGAIVLVFGLFLFAIQDVIIKHFSSHYIWFRERQAERGETALVPLQAAEIPQREA